MAMGNVQLRRKCDKTIGRRAVESLAMMMIGDGVLAVVMPERHMKVWERGPHIWEMMMRQFIKRPELTRWLGAVEVATGIWIAQQLKPERDSDAWNDVT